MDERVAGFFNDQAADYHASADESDIGRMGMGGYHVRTAAAIEAQIAGRVLCVGGLWSRMNPEVLGSCEVTVVDLSADMLSHYQELGVELMVGDARSLAVGDNTFDHVVFPLVLHHITDQSGVVARSNVRRALAEARRVLKPGGRIWISEFSVSRPVYAAEILLAPVTSRALGLKGIPLVVMHHADFYQKSLREQGFGDIALKPIQATRASPFDLIQPVIGLPMLRVPRFMYPVTPVLITARSEPPAAR